MSKTVRRKNADFKKSFLFSDSDLDSNGLVDGLLREWAMGLTLDKANKKASALFHSCKGPKFKFVAGKGYRQEYRAKSKQQLREQLNNHSDYDSISIDRLCSDWKYW